MHSTLADCYILKYLLSNLIFGVTLDTQTNIWLSKVILAASRIQNEIACGLFGTRYKFLTQTAPFVIKLVDVRFNCSLSTKSGKFDHLKID